MFTLVYINDKFNRPSPLLPFLQSNIGKRPLMQIDCISPYQGSLQDLIRDTCDHLNNIDPDVEVSCCSIQNSSSDVKEDNTVVNFVVIQIAITHKK